MLNATTATCPECPQTGAGFPAMLTACEDGTGHECQNCRRWYMHDWIRHIYGSAQLGAMPRAWRTLNRSAR